ncbi:MAG: hypothetical protein JWM58_3468 [Rhizobium sp.]|nr:hypothetical protein [Rhizobium sp.]
MMLELILTELADPTTKLTEFLEKLVHLDDVEPVRALANEAFAEGDPNVKFRMISQATAVNPFFVPVLAAGADAKQVFNMDAWCKSIAMARMVAANTKTNRILVSSAPKTGSTFIAGAISRAFDLKRVSLTLLSAKPYGHVSFGGALRDHDVDELTLITATFNPKGFLAHHHMICTPYLAKQMSLYGVTPIITKRNIFDTFVSFDDHIRKVYASVPEANFLRLGFPAEWIEMDFDDRIDMLLDLQLLWYAKYYSSWKLCEAQGQTKPLWISYEQDLKGDSEVLATRICEALGRPEEAIPELAAALGQNGTKGEHFNKGINGRGEAITGKNRQRIKDFFHKYRMLADFSDILEP